MFGRILAGTSVFFLMTTLGRFVATVLLGLLSTLVLILFTGNIGDKIVFNTLLSLITAIIFMVLANEFIIKLGHTNSITRGMSMVAIAFIGYLINLSMCYFLNDEVPEATILPSLLGLTVAFGYEMIGSNIRKPSLSLRI